MIDRLAASLTPHFNAPATKDAHRKVPSLFLLGAVKPPLTKCDPYDIFKHLPQQQATPPTLYPLEIKSQQGDRTTTITAQLPWWGIVLVAGGAGIGAYLALR